MKKSTLNRIIIAAVVSMLPSIAVSDTSALFGKSLVCSTSISGYTSKMTAFVSRDRVFLYHGGDRSKLGTVYEFAGTHSGMSSANSYTSNARLSGDQIQLSRTVTNRTCRICDGKTIMQSDEIVISSTGQGWGATRNYRQWFEDGTQAAVPSGSESYTCAVAAGRVGVGR